MKNHKQVKNQCLNDSFNGIRFCCQVLTSNLTAKTSFAVTVRCSRIWSYLTLTFSAAPFPWSYTHVDTNRQIRAVLSIIACFPAGDSVESHQVSGTLSDMNSFVIS